MNYWLLIPKEIQKEIFSFCKYPYRFVIQFVCKEWKDIVSKTKNAEWSIELCIRDGELKLLEWLVIEKSYKMIKNPYFWCIFNWNLKSIQWLKEHNYRWNWKVWREVVDSSHCKGCLYNNCIFNDKVLSVLEWLLKEKCPWNDKILFRARLFGNCYKVSKWLVHNGCPVSYDALSLIDQTTEDTDGLAELMRIAYINNKKFIKSNKIHNNVKIK